MLGCAAEYGGRLRCFCPMVTRVSLSDWFALLGKDLGVFRPPAIERVSYGRGGIGLQKFMRAEGITCTGSSEGACGSALQTGLPPWARIRGGLKPPAIERPSLRTGRHRRRNNAGCGWLEDCTGMVLQGCGVSMYARSQRFAGRGSKAPGY